MYTRRWALSVASILLSACAQPGDAGSMQGGVSLSWPTIPERVQRAEFGAQADGSLVIELDSFYLDFQWKEAGSTKSARYLVPAVTGSKAEDVKRVSISYNGEKSGTAVAPDFELHVPGVPLMSGGTLKVEGYARGIEDVPIMVGEIKGKVDVTENGVSELEVSMNFTEAFDSDGDGYVLQAAGGSDCDDEDSDRYTGAPEVCDGQDTACDGREDEADHCAFTDPTYTNTPMQLVPGGEGYVGWKSMEGAPNTKIYLDPFYIDRYEVSLTQYAACATCTSPASTDVGNFENYNSTNFEQYPVVHVSWVQAATYCISRGKRLPTEFEWEVAARGLGDTDRPVPWTENNTFTLDELPANVMGWSTGGPQPVSVLPEGMSPYGVFHMMGNVAEWTSSWFSSVRYSSIDESLATPPVEPLTGSEKVYKGGGWNVPASESFPYQRASATTDTTDPGLGFRCALDIP